MPTRAEDWFRQAEADLRHARNALEDGDYEWACFAAQQAVEKAAKAVYQSHHLEGWGHTTSLLLGNLPESLRPGDDVLDLAKTLDKHYIFTRYPNGFEVGAPTDFYTRAEAEHAAAIAERILAFCRDQIR